ncbi:MAG: hypothetical protein IJN19_03070 [Opitutales bacterium]|nr:hypothetical protein [Opitutales bacterium]
MNSGFKGAIFSCALHGAAFAALIFFSAQTQGNDVVSASDPLLAMFADENADPTKSAGLVGEELGLAEGSTDGNTLENPDFSDELEALNDAAEEALEKPLPEPEPEPVPAEPSPAVATPEPAKPVPAETKTPAPEKTKPEVKKPAPKKPAPKPKNTTSGGKKMSLEEFRKQNKPKQPKKPGSGKKSGSGKRTTAKIDLSKVTSGGKRFGVPGGTGGNGGEGGRAVASAQQVYASEVAQKLATHLDNVLEQQPLTLEFAVSVEVRLQADASGNIRLLEVIGNNDAQVRERVAKAVSRIGKFRKPPEGRAFSISLPNVVIRPQ